MVGKFLLGMMSGSLLVAGGLVVGSVVAPPQRPAAEPDSTATPVTAPEPVAADAGASAPADPVVADSAPADPETAAVAGSAEAPPDAGDAAAPPVVTDAEPMEPEAPAEPEPPVVAEAEPEPPALAEAAPQAPAGPAAEAPALAAPAATEVTAPETALVPDRPVETEADMAATPDLATPEPAPAPTPEPTPAPPAEPTVLAEADPGVAAVEPEPAAPPEVTAGAEPTPLPEPAPEPLPEPALTPDPEAAPEPAQAAEPAAPVAEDAAPSSEIALAPETAPEPAPEPAPGDAAAVTDPGGDPSTTAEAVPDAGAEGADTSPPVADAMPAPAAPEVAAEEAAPPLPGEQPDAMPGTPATQEIAEEEGRASTFVPAPRLVRRGEGLIIGRGNAEATPAPSADPMADPAVDPAADPAAVPEDPRPIARFAATFENPSAKPPLAILLVDDGAPDLDRAGLAALPFPVSFALDPLDPATPERAAIYRAAGREVVMLVTGIAQGAQPADVEVAFQSMEQGLPEAVAVMDLATPTFQSNRGLAGVVVPILKASGRGLLTRDGGLNAADQVARREDVEAAVVFRDLDAAGTERGALRRLLDRAVFKAGQDGRVTVVGTASPDLAAALLEWTVEGRAATVALAPVTATLRVD